MLFPDTLRPLGLLAFAACLSTGIVQAAPTKTALQIIVDNDFAVFVGTTGSITRLLYQNNVVWNSQIAAAQTFVFDIEDGENTLYVLAMGGGGQENISGLINGVNITEIANVAQSQPIAASLFNYNAATVTNGTYNADLGNVQGIFGNLVFGAPTPNPTSPVPTVIAQNTFSGGKGFSFQDSNAVFYRFSTGAVGVVPETSSTLALGGLLSFGLLSRKRRR